MLINKPDIEEVLMNEGLELKRRGNALWGRCPLHAERTPSFRVDLERQRYYCYGCTSHGDVISFIQKFKSLSFKEALGYLGITGKPTKPDVREVKKRELLKKFKHWCYTKHDSLCSLYRELQEIKALVRTEQDSESLADFYHQESSWMRQIEILQGSDDEAKFNLYKELCYGQS
jgi:hypothetical protein